MIDIIYLAHNRLEFTRESYRHLIRNTDWSQVRTLVKYVDVDERGSDDGTSDMLINAALADWHPNDYAIPSYFRQGTFGGPVNVMKEYLREFGNEDHVFVKLDSDVIVPPGWLYGGMEVMARHPELSFLGIEPPESRTRAPWEKKLTLAPEYSCFPEKDARGFHYQHTFAPCDAIGGIGFMRSQAFRGREEMVQHSTYGGFTDWQIRNRDLLKGWIVPPMQLFLLDRLPIEPWASLSREYIARGWQRPWTNYPVTAAPYLWEWWAKGW
jgi:hypothetical protein